MSRFKVHIGRGNEEHLEADIRAAAVLRHLRSPQPWLIRTDRHTILLDSCAGNHKDRSGYSRFHQLNTPFLQRLRSAGVASESQAAAMLRSISRC
jgi:hypothetical protein